MSVMYICVMSICNINILCVMKCYYEMRYTLNYISLKNTTSYYEMRFLERYVYLCYVNK